MNCPECGAEFVRDVPADRLVHVREGWHEETLDDGTTEYVGKIVIGSITFTK